MCEVLNKELADADEKIRANGGKISAGDLEYIDRLTHAAKSVKTIMAMMESDGYSGADGWMVRKYYEPNRSYAGRRGAKRDSMGRYSSGGYSMAHEGMVHELRELMEDAPDDRTRQEFQKFITKIEQMG